MSIGGANARTANSNKFIYAGADYKVTKDLLCSTTTATWISSTNRTSCLVHNWAIGPGVLKTDLRYFNSTDDGKTVAFLLTTATVTTRAKPAVKARSTTTCTAVCCCTPLPVTPLVAVTVSNGSSDLLVEPRRRSVELHHH